MDSQHFAPLSVPDRFPQVEAARLMLIVVRFARPTDPAVRLPFAPSRPVVGHFTPEYYLHKLDFLLRYPGYLIYELTELFRMGKAVAADRDEVVGIIKAILRNREPERRTIPVPRFWRGAYESIDDVESWWYSRQLVYTAFQPRGEARPQKHYFLTELAISEAQRMVAEVEHARWYQDRIDLIFRFFGQFTPAEIKNWQYSHPAYRDAQLREQIPDLTAEEISTNFANVFGEELEVGVE